MLKLKYPPEGFGRRLVGEMWLYPDGSRILELSTKCRPARRSRWPPRRGPSWPATASTSTGEQQTKTTTALEYFSRRVTAP